MTRVTPRPGSTQGSQGCYPDSEQGGVLVTWFEDAPPLPACLSAPARARARSPAVLRAAPRAVGESWVGWGAAARGPKLLAGEKGGLKQGRARIGSGPGGCGPGVPWGLWWCCGALGQGGTHSWGAGTSKGVQSLMDSKPTNA